MTPEAVQHGQAVYFDGRSNRKRNVVLRFANGLDIIEQDAVVATWPYSDVRRTDAPPDLLRLSCTTELPLARLEIADAATRQAVRLHCKSLDVGRGRTQTWQIVGWSAAAAASILGLVLYGIPLAAGRLAPFVPYSFERRIGDAIDGQVRRVFGGKVCSGAEGQVAFASLVDKLRRAGQLDLPLETQVLASSTPNAFALPGGRIYLLDGLLQRARNPDEIAGVIAHELGHVKHRDHLRQLIQTGGSSFLFGLLFGDVTGAGAVIFVARSMLDASYSREAERAADVLAIEVMHKLGRSPQPMGEFLFRVTGAQANRSLTILASHPLTEERLEAMKRADRPASGPELLSESEWRALKNICRSSTDRAARSSP